MPAGPEDGEEVEVEVEDGVEEVEFEAGVAAGGG